MKQEFIKAGFTLVEIMIVVAIIGLLAGIGIPSFRKARQHTLLRNMEKNATVVSHGIALYALEKGLQDTAPIAKDNISPYLKNGWEGLDIGQNHATFPENKTVKYWTTNATTIASDLYGSLYTSNN